MLYMYINENKIGAIKNLMQVHYYNTNKDYYRLSNVFRI